MKRKVNFIHSSTCVPFIALLLKEMTNSACNTLNVVMESESVYAIHAAIVCNTNTTVRIRKFKGI